MYSGMLNEIMNTLDENTIRKYNEMIQQISNDYCYANIYLQLPGAVSLPSHMTSSTQHISGPLICRNSLRSRDEILQQYSLNSLQFEHILLIGFGGHDVPWDIFHNPLNLPIPENWICLILGGTEASSSSSSTSSSPSSSRILSIPYQCYVPDLISISSVVLGKLGYGFMSECLSHDVPLLYITRSCWPEEDYLRDYMTNYQINDQDKSKINCLEMNYDDFIGGNWEKYLQKCLQGRKVWNGDVIEETRRMELRQRQQLERLDEIYQVICSLETK